MTQFMLFVQDWQLSPYKSQKPIKYFKYTDIAIICHHKYKTWQ